MMRESLRPLFAKPRLSMAGKSGSLATVSFGKPQSYANILNFEELYEGEWMEVSPLHEGDERQRS